MKKKLREREEGIGEKAKLERMMSWTGTKIQHQRVTAGFNVFFQKNWSLLEGRIPGNEETTRSRQTEMCFWTA